MTQDPTKEQNPSVEDVDLPDDEGQASLLTEFFWFLKDNKKWWLIPMILIFLLLGMLMMVGSGPLSPFLYTFL
jgi:hypothetical protein